MIKFFPAVALICGLTPSVLAQCETAPFYPGALVASLGELSDGQLSLMTYENDVLLLGADSGSWTTVDSFVLSAGGLGFGFEVAPLGLYRNSTFVAGIGAAGAGFEGRVDVLDPSGMVTTLVPTDLAVNDGFGSGLAIHDDLIVVGSSMAVYDVGACGPGKSYVYERNAGGWGLVAQFAPHGFSSIVTFYGYHVDTDGATIVFGAPADDEADSQVGANGAGAVYVYEKDLAGWHETAKLVASDAAAGSAFGSDIAVLGDQLLVGSPDRGAGAVYVFERGAAGWVETQIVTPSMGQPGDKFGLALDIDGDRAVVGAPGVDSALADSGAFYVLERDTTGAWSETVRDVAMATNPGEAWGADVALDGNQVFWSSWYAGSLRFTSLGIDNAQNYCVSTPNSSGSAASISALGCDSVVANGFELQAVDLPPNRTGLFFHGPNSAQYPFGNGTMCIGAGRQRLRVLRSDTAGVMSAAVDFTSPRTQQIQAGSTWHFQTYFRDAGVGAGFDLSDAVAVRIQS
ncbi:MAG: hypothetical protein ACI8QZ_003536 [Chlamydiales bacterium]